MRQELILKNPSCRTHQAEITPKEKKKKPIIKKKSYYFFQGRNILPDSFESRTNSSNHITPPRSKKSSSNELLEVPDHAAPQPGSIEDPPSKIQEACFDLDNQDENSLGSSKTEIRKDALSDKTSFMVMKENNPNGLLDSAKMQELDYSNSATKALPIAERIWNDETKNPTSQKVYFNLDKQEDTLSKITEADEPSEGSTTSIDQTTERSTSSTGARSLSVKHSEAMKFSLLKQSKSIKPQIDPFPLVSAYTVREVDQIPNYINASDLSLSSKSSLLSIDSESSMPTTPEKLETIFVSKHRERSSGDMPLKEEKRIEEEIRKDSETPRAIEKSEPKTKGTTPLHYSGLNTFSSVIREKSQIKEKSDVSPNKLLVDSVAPVFKLIPFDFERKEVSLSPELLNLKPCCIFN